MNAESIELSPCPFCGGRAEIKYRREGAKNDIVTATVYCTKCRCNSGKWYQEEEAVKTWNRRVDGHLCEGNWIQSENTWKCPNCFRMVGYHWNFCPECGCKKTEEAGQDSNTIQKRAYARGREEAESQIAAKIRECINSGGQENTDRRIVGRIEEIISGYGRKTN